MGHWCDAILVSPPRPVQDTLAQPYLQLSHCAAWHGFPLASLFIRLTLLVPAALLSRLFSKKFPFFDDAEVVKQAKLEAVEFAVTNVPIPYDFAPWTYMSAEGLSFMQSCLVRDEELRASTEDLLQHPWLRRYIAAEELAHALEGGCTIA